MAIQQTKRQSDLEKRLQILRRQIYGKSPEELKITQVNQKTNNTQIPSNPQSSESSRFDLAYLYKDLTKILVFSTLAIGGQIILFFLLQNHILKI